MKQKKRQYFIKKDLHKNYISLMFHIKKKILAIIKKNKKCLEVSNNSDNKNNYNCFIYLVKSLLFFKY